MSIIWQNRGQKLFYFKVLIKIFPTCNPVKRKVVTHHYPVEKVENWGKGGSWFIITSIKIVAWGDNGSCFFLSNKSNCVCHNNFVHILLGLMYSLEKLSTLGTNFLVHNMFLNLKNLSKDFHFKKIFSEDTSYKECVKLNLNPVLRSFFAFLI